MKQVKARIHATSNAPERAANPSAGMHQTVGREMRNLERAVQNTAGDKWSVVKRSAMTGKFQAEKS